MKLIQAIIKPFKLDDVKSALTLLGVTGLTVTEVRGFERQWGPIENYRGAEYTADLVPKLKIEVAVEDDEASGVASTVINSARTGGLGDGKVFVLDLNEVMRIRTNERGDSAL